MISKLREVAKENKNWNLVQLANALNLKTQTVCNWAQNNKMPNPFYLDLLCTILECKISDIYITEKTYIAILDD